MKEASALNPPKIQSECWGKPILEEKLPLGMLDNGVQLLIHARDREAHREGEQAARTEHLI